MNQEIYIGDGVYASIDQWGVVKLRAPRERGDHEVYLDSDMLNAVIKLAKKAGAIT